MLIKSMKSISLRDLKMVLAKNYDTSLEFTDVQHISKCRHNLDLNLINSESNWQYRHVSDIGNV